jgi:hypothetical protein
MAEKIPLRTSSLLVGAGLLFAAGALILHFALDVAFC